MKMKDIVAEGTLDDLGLRGHGRELDQDDEGGPGFKQTAMFDQLGKILDSKSNPNPLTHVTTDDGEKVDEWEFYYENGDLIKIEKYINGITHTLNEEYYERIEAIQFTMNHDDGNLVNDIEKSDIILVGVSRTSKTPTSIYLANKGLKTSNIPLVNENSLPKKLRENPQITCVVGLNTEPDRLVDLRKNRMNTLKETENSSYTDIEKIRKDTAWKDLPCIAITSHTTNEDIEHGYKKGFNKYIGKFDKDELARAITSVLSERKAA